MSRAKSLVALGAGIVLGGLLVVVATPMLRGVEDTPSTGRAWKGEAGCGDGMTPAQLDEALELGSAFLLANQRPAGNFAYEWDWKKQQDSTGDNEVRQSGATWGLALILHDDPSRTDVREGLLKALDFWKSKARTSPDGRRWVLYDGNRGSTGTVALLALAHVDLLRAEVELPEARRTEVEQHLTQLLAFLRSQRDPSGGFHSYFRPDGQGFGKANPYADGEALLAAVKAANYADHPEMLELAVSWAREDRERYVVEPRREDPDPDLTKGYYQWTSMAWWELSRSEAADAEPWGEWLVELAVWMIDDHRTLKRTRNTAYAYEGIIPAYAWARDHGDARAAKLRCVIDQGLKKLTSWQLGHSLANAYVKQAPASDLRGRGGIQNTDDEAPLRIDVTQHQMHAIILARRLYP